MRGGKSLSSLLLDNLWVRRSLILGSTIPVWRWTHRLPKCIWIVLVESRIWVSLLVLIVTSIAFFGKSLCRMKRRATLRWRSASLSPVSHTGYWRTLRRTLCERMSHREAEYVTRNQVGRMDSGNQLQTGRTEHFGTQAVPAQRVRRDRFGTEHSAPGDTFVLKIVSNAEGWQLQ